MVHSAFACDPEGELVPFGWTGPDQVISDQSGMEVLCNSPVRQDNHSLIAAAPGSGIAVQGEVPLSEDPPTASVPKA